MKKCPYCAEEIQDEAIFCRYCNHDLITIASEPIYPQKAVNDKASCKNILFSFKGRVGRPSFWLSVIVYSIIGNIVYFLLYPRLYDLQNELKKYGIDGVGTYINEKNSILFLIIFLIVLILTVLILFFASWSMIAIAIKRWHDRDKSGWWELLGLVPLVGWGWRYIELGFLKGTAGSNKYGMTNDNINASLVIKLFVIFPLVGIILFISLPTSSRFSPTYQPFPTSISANKITTQIPNPQPRLTETIMVTTTASLGIGSTKVSPKDRKVLVFVPEGEFLMGSPEGEGKPDEHPQHTVLLDAYWIDKFEVTNDEYNQCLLAGKCTEPKPTGGNKNPHPLDLPSIASNPVVGVDWNQSKTYCEWAGRRLPTEAEWEKAARGTNSRIYPWGNISPTNIFLNYGNKISKTTKVGSYPEGVSPYGALDMAGNVWEWTSDLYDERFYWGVDYVPPTCSPNGTIKWQDEDGTWKESSYPGWCDTANYGTKSVEAKFINPVGPLPDQGYVSHVLRGGSYRDQAFVVRSASRTRNLPTFTSSEVGFRCAVSQ